MCLQQKKENEWNRVWKKDTTKKKKKKEIEITLVNAFKASLTALPRALTKLNAGFACRPKKRVHEHYTAQWSSFFSV